jgi:spore photoproduct lyase
MKNQQNFKISAQKLKLLDAKNLKLILKFNKISLQNTLSLWKMLIDFQQWDIGKTKHFLDKIKTLIAKNGQKKAFLAIKTKYEELLLKRKYTKKTKITPKQTKKNKKQKKQEGKVFGFCPVYSDETLCCNLYTIDAVLGCGFGCSYCSVMSFYQENEVNFIQNLPEKLKQIKLDKNQNYHIGTGQSSDSLLWGNKANVLDALCQFAETHHKNVILEFKTKSANIKYFLKNPSPKNIVLSWSLNPQVIIDHEEHLCAGLEQRLAAAKTIRKMGIKIGFHLHPVIVFENYHLHYKNMIERIMKLFDGKQVSFVSMGSLTFSKKSIKDIRNKNINTRILQMPMEKSFNKFSYPYKTKLEVFSKIYSYFKPWHNKTFFYFCMEDKNLSQEILNIDYKDNKEFSEALFNAIKKTG